MPIALVTAETENRVIAVALRSGRVLRRVAVPGDPEDIATCGDAFVVSPRAGAVSLIDPQSLHVVAMLRGFDSPHIVACSPDGEHAYVTDDASGMVSVIDDASRRVADRVYVGPGAHHMAFAPNQRRLWVALGESARTIVILDTTNVSRPRVIGRLHLGFPVHDLGFSGDGRRVWVSSAAGPEVAVLSARSHRILFHVRVGAPPQHVSLVGATAYLTSGYGGVIERAAVANGRVLGRARTPYGSFELATGEGFVATASLLDGRLTVLDPGLRRLRVLRLAVVTREVAISVRFIRR
jgi:YVTN family beta-propeller protein